MSDLTNKSADYLRGYQVAMLEVGEFCLEETKLQDKIHAATPPTFFGNPRPAHYTALGGGRCSKKVGEYVFMRGTQAFARRIK